VSHGGARTGAGRPRKDDAARPFGPFRIDADRLDAYRAQATAEGVSLTAWVLAACDERLSRAQRPPRR
jgi:hypothetical protein